MLPLTSPADLDDKHAKYRRLVCLRSGYRCGTNCIVRTILLFLFPLVTLLSTLIRTKQTDSLVITPPGLLVVFFALSSIGFALERMRLKSRLIHRVPFIAILGLVLVIDFLLLSSYIFQDSYHIQRDFLNSHQQDTVERFNISGWNDIYPTIAFDEKAVQAMSATEIAMLHLANYEKGVASIILPSHNENEYMKRTLDSILNSTSPGLLREIIIVDDASTSPLNSTFDTNIYKTPFVKVHRNEFREGLINSKRKGGDLAEGRILVFLDAHVRPDSGWLLPIMRHINQNPKRVVVPQINVLDGKTWVVNRNAVGSKMMFDWNMKFHWFEDDTQWVPCMSGGLLAISKEWWVESGALDPGMDIWGGENIEQSIRVWLCGGEIVVAHDSVISHVFRKDFPYSIDNSKVLCNYVRTAEVWMDEYKDYFYNASSSAVQQLRPHIAIPAPGASYVDPAIEELPCFANISKRVALREKLHCKPFQWYVDKFKDVFIDKGMLAVDSFLIRNIESNLCIVPNEIQNSTSLTAVECHRDDLSQRWTMKYNGTAIQHMKRKLCLDATIGKMPSEWRIHIVDANGNAKRPVIPLSHSPEVYKCLKNNMNQKNWIIRDGQFMFGSYCLEIIQPTIGSPSPVVVLTSCTAVDINGERKLPSPRQNFEMAFKEIIKPF